MSHSHNVNVLLLGKGKIGSQEVYFPGSAGAWGSEHTPQRWEA